MKPFDPTKPVQTRAGMAAKIICTDRKHPIYPIVAVYKGMNPEMEELNAFTADGKFTHNGPHSENDLINIPEPPKLRPWKPEEVQLFAEYRSKACQDVRCLLFRVSSQGVVFPIRDGESNLQSFSDLLSNWTHSLDCDKTWKPCGVLE